MFLDMLIVKLSLSSLENHWMTYIILGLLHVLIMVLLLC